MARLGEYLLKEGLITEAALTAALAQQKEGEFLGSILVKQGAIEEGSLAKAIEKQSSSPFIDLERIPLDARLAAVIPQSFAEKTRCIPIRVEKQVLYIGAVDPTNVMAWDELARHSEKSIRTFTVRESQLASAWKRIYGDANDTALDREPPATTTLKVKSTTPPNGAPHSPEKKSSGAFARTGLFRGASAPQPEPPPPPMDPQEAFDIEKLRASLDEVEVVSEVEEDEGPGYDMIAAAATDSPTVRLVNGFIYEAQEKGASDIHIEPFEDATRVRYRVDGVLVERVSLPRQNHRMLISRIKVMAQLDISERRLPQDGRVRMRMGEKTIDLRISTLPSQYGEKVVIRLLGGALVKENVDQLGLKARDLDRLKWAVSATNGMILVTGPTGSGKTTTLYTILRQLNEPGVNITTAEDPVEYEQRGIIQVQVKPDIGLTFAAALRSFLRQDPDIIMVGEIRDLETAEIAIKAALTGHLVLSTLHTNDAIWTIARLIEMGIEPFLVGAAVRAVVAQRLVRRLCSQCKRPAPESEYQAVKRVAPDRPRPKQLYSAGRCGACSQGFRGRTPVFEVFSLDKDDVKKVVTEGAKRDQLIAAARADGMRTLVERALEYVEDGTTTFEEAWACCGM